MKKRTPEQKDRRPLQLSNSYDLQGEGLSTVLGELEARVMRLVWAMDRPQPAKGVYQEVVREHDVALPTVITVLNKLVKKGLLERAKTDGVYHYSPVWTPEEFREQVSRRVVEGMLAFGPSAVAACFVDVVAERDPALLEELRALLNSRSSQRAEDEGGGK